jgi:transcriptional regulator with XRE-family HTH domain
MPTPAGSVDRRRLRTVLRRERETARLTQDQVAAAMDWSLSKIIRIESGTVSISTTDLRALLDLYDVSTPEQKSELVALARSARRPPWWAAFRDFLTPAFVYYIGLEPNAAELSFFSSTLLPGILQTDEYARAALVASAPDLDDSMIQMRLNVRLKRQSELFDQPSPPRLSVVLDEAAVRRQVGGSQVLRQQLEHLTEIAHRPYVRLRVVPFASGAHAGTFGPYVLMDFPDPVTDPPVLFHEGALEDEMVREKPGVVETYRRSFAHLRSTALEPAPSLEFIRRAMDDLG